MKKSANVFLVFGFFSAILVALFFGHLDLWIWKEGDLGQREWNRRVLLPLAFAAIEGLSLFAINFETVRAALTSRRALVAANVVVMVVAALGIAGFVNVIAVRRFFRADWTLRGTYTLSERTETVLQGLDRPVKAYVIAPRFHDFFNTVRGTLDMYQAAAHGNLKVDYFDPAQDPERLRAALHALGIEPKSLDESELVIFESPREAPALPRTRHVPFSGLVEVDYTFGGRGRPKGFKAEELFTEAILDVSRDRQTAVYLLGGHEERHPSSQRPEERISSLETKLKTLGYRVETFEFAFGGEEKRTEVPADCDVLVIAGAEGRFDDREIEGVKAFLARGGRAFILGEPVVRQRPASRSVFFDDPRIDEILKPYGLGLEKAYVFDSSSVIGEVAPFSFLPRVTGVAEAHPITKPLVGTRILFNVAQPVLIQQDQTGPNVKTQAILETVASAVAVRDLNARDPTRGDPRKGPVILAAVATAPATATPTAASIPTGTAAAETRIVLVGDVNVATDDVIDRLPSNADFVLNSIAWLAEREETIAIGSKPPEIIRLKLDDEQRKRLRLMALVELPLLCAIIALVVFWVRRS